MTSKNSKECFVYITLPGETKAVTAAKYELSGLASGQPVGRLVYGKSYIARPNAVEIDPVELRLGATIAPTTKFNGVYGALRDASPDFWGRLIIERANRVTRLDEMEYLLQSSDARAGALAFGHSNVPPGPDRDFNKIFDLEELQETARRILDEEELDGTAQEEHARRLLLVGTGMGGARPKAVVEDDEGLWIAKFNKDTDPWDSAKVEHMMLRLAQECGISTSQSKVTAIGHQNVLLVKRFDRELVKDGYLRARMVSALTLLRSEDTVDAKMRGEWSYLELVEALRRISGDPKRDAHELFRRMCFNAAATNTDDHARNHAVIAMDNTWKLSPAYDLTPTPSVGMQRYLQMIAGDQGTAATAENLLSQAGRFLLSPEEAQAIVSQVSDCVRNRWYGIARREQVTEGDCERIRASFENEGFTFKATLPPPTKRPAKKAATSGKKGNKGKSKRAPARTARR